MLITITQQQAPLRWTVHMDAWFVHFTSLAAAEDFVHRLRARLDAPHPWPSVAAPSGTTGSAPALIRTGGYG
ncbi:MULTISPECIES: hypothetical protein [Pseudomonas]|jgi:hypothetical protein|uniref:Uncharacterized protein n=1 Tax=Pseudomonas gorinensis TaxID=3240790 RepID=A0ACA7P7B9_9PSED|nr:MULTISPECIES: hypothetical protein [Pseudomonas]AHC35895.1 hypothetical protein U771_16875 [Pseudomonas sp. TKP]MBL1311909.1 hypothetical protein [Pseudomonas sp.]PMX14951.1 hypothetical protein C1Y25_13115 [Pseudomonas sp. MPBC4-3]PMX44949.1 hypothetical protein C1Y20_22980 [Pseudomonas sp. FW301-21B01]PMY03235.1 hypothetical protein C1Y18_26845 [Pseudomonas sp. MPR-R5A]